MELWIEDLSQHINMKLLGKLKRLYLYNIKNINFNI